MTRCCLAARERGGGLTDFDVPEPYVLHKLQLTRHIRDVLKKVHPLVHRHVEHVRDGLAADFDLQRLFVVSRALTDLAGHVDVGEKVHLDLDRAVALAGLAAPALDVEREAPRLVAALARLGRAGKKVADFGEDARVGGRVAPGRASDGALVDFE